MSDIDFYRLQAAEATRQAGAATQDKVRERCSLFAGWWSAIADSLEAGETDAAAALTAKIIHFSPRALVPAR